MSLGYQIIDHIADIGIILKAPDIESLFVRAALSMTDLMVKGDNSEKKLLKDVKIKGHDLPDLMVRWLGEILYLFQGEKLLVHSIEDITIRDKIQLMSRLQCARYNRCKHEVLMEIKAVTYHQISIVKTNEGWETKVIFDI